MIRVATQIPVVFNANPYTGSSVHHDTPRFFVSQEHFRKAAIVSGLLCGLALPSYRSLSTAVLYGRSGALKLSNNRFVL